MQVPEYCFPNFAL